MGFGQAARDGEAQSGAARSAASRCLQPTERLEHGLPVFRTLAFTVGFLAQAVLALGIFKIV